MIPQSYQHIASGSTIPKQEDLTCQVAQFDGWYKEEALINKWNWDTDTITGDTTLYAKWINQDFSNQEYIQVDGDMHKQKCKYCDVYSSPEVCTGGTATCTKKAICDVCKKEYGEIDAENHTPATPVKENLVPATCDTDGSYDSVVYCSECEKELSRETKPEAKVGHTWNADYTVDVEATTTKEGSKSIHCGICGAIKEGSTVTIPKKEEVNPTPTASPSDSPTDKPSGKPSSTVAPTARPTPAAVVKPAKVKITSAKNNKKKTITVKIKKAKNAKSYKIQYATDKKFKKAKTKNSKNLTVTLKGLKKKKTYYIRVCGVNGKVVGAWSSVKKVKVKK